MYKCQWMVGTTFEVKMLVPFSASEWILRANLSSMALWWRFDFNSRRLLKHWYAEGNSGEKAERHSEIDPGRSGYWKKQKSELVFANKQCTASWGWNEESYLVTTEKAFRADLLVLKWDKHNPSIKKWFKKKNVSDIYLSEGGKIFVASRGWLQKCLKRNGLSLQCHINIAQKDPDLLTTLANLSALKGFLRRTLFNEQDCSLIKFGFSPARANWTRIWSDSLSEFVGCLWKLMKTTSSS